VGPWAKLPVDELIAQAHGRRLAVGAEGGRLIVRGPADSDVGLVQTLLARKPEVLAHLMALSADEQIQFDERAAIAEYDGGLSRAEAECLAWAEIEAGRQRRHTRLVRRGGHVVIYLASPYSHPDAAVRQQRFHDACRATAALLHAGHVVFSPVVQSHPLVAYGLPGDWAFWERVDREHLERCDDVVVLMLDGWRESVGVQAEIRLATAFGKEVHYVAPAVLLPPETAWMPHGPR